MSETDVSFPLQSAWRLVVLCIVFSLGIVTGGLFQVEEGEGAFSFC